MSKYFVEVRPHYAPTARAKYTLETIQQRLDHIVFESPYGIDYVNDILNEIVNETNSIKTTYTGITSKIQVSPFHQRSAERNETYETSVFRAQRCDIATVRVLKITSEIPKGGEE